MHLIYAIDFQVPQRSFLSSVQIELNLYTFFFFFLNNFIYKTITYTIYSINYTHIVLATNTTDTYTYTNYAYTTLRYMYYNTININLIYGWRVYKVLFN